MPELKIFFNILKYNDLFFIFWVLGSIIELLLPHCFSAVADALHQERVHFNRIPFRCSGGLDFVGRCFHGPGQDAVDFDPGVLDFGRKR